MLEQIGLEFSIMPSYAKETYKETRPDKIVEELSALKAIDVADRLDDSYIVIGADTIVVADEKILGKPKDEKDAFLMLESLQGKTHQVYSGVTLVVSHGDKKIIKRFHEKTEVAVAEMTKNRSKLMLLPENRWIKQVLMRFRDFLHNISRELSAITIM